MEDLEDEYQEPAVKCGFRKIKADLDPFDRERNPIGGVNKYNSPKGNPGGREVDWNAEAKKESDKHSKIKGYKSR